MVMDAAGKAIDRRGRDDRKKQMLREARREFEKHGSERRRSLPVLEDPAEELDAPLSEIEGRECVSLDGSPRPADGAPLTPRSNRSAGGERERKSFQRRPLSKHEALPSLHLNARCLNCNRVGTLYCKVCSLQQTHKLYTKGGFIYLARLGCEAHFCAKHDRRRHRFMLRKKRHQPQPLPGISYFRIPLTADKAGGGRGDDSDSVLANNSDSILDEFSETRSSTSSNSAAAKGKRNGKWAAVHRHRPKLGRSVAAIAGKGKSSGGGGTDAGQKQPVALSMRPRGERRAGGRAGPGQEDGGTQSAEGTANRRRRRSTAMDQAQRNWYDRIVMAIVRPPRCIYTQEDMGPTLIPLHSGPPMKRRDFEVRNRRGLKLVCSQWRPAFAEDTSKLPCVVYLHGNSSARVDVVKTRSLPVLNAARCTVVAFDFSGSGMSEGEWVTLGYFEQHDVADVLAYLRSNAMASRYLLWGRSMGAASALLYAACYPNSDLCGLVLDSPFSSFRRLARDLVTGGQIHVPGFMVNGALALLRHSVKNRTRCDLKTVAPITRASSIRCPCLFIAARKDVMVKPHHGLELSDAVGGASLFVTCRGSHNSSRPNVVLEAIGTFVKGCFRAPDVPISETLTAIQEALAEALESAKARRARGRNVTAGGVGGEGLVPGAIQAAAAVEAEIETKGAGLTWPRPPAAPGRRESVPAGVEQLKIQEVRKISSFDDLAPRATSFEGATNLAEAADDVADKLRPPQLTRSKSQNAGDGDLDRTRKPSARSSHSSGRDSVVEAHDIEEDDGIGVEEPDADVSGRNSEGGEGPRNGRRRGIRAVFPGKAHQVRRRFKEKASDAATLLKTNHPARTLGKTADLKTSELSPPPPPPASFEGFEGDMEASDHSRGEGRKWRTNKSSPREATEVAPKRSNAGSRANASADSSRGSARAAKLATLGGAPSGPSQSRQVRGSFVGNGGGRGRHSGGELRGGPGGALEMPDLQVPTVPAPGSNGAHSPARRHQGSMEQSVGSDSSGWWRVRLKAPAIGSLGRNGRRERAKGAGGRQRGGNRSRNVGGEEPVSTFPSVQSRRGSSSRVCNVCANPSANCLCGSGAGPGSSKDDPHVLRTMKGKLKM